MDLIKQKPFHKQLEILKSATKRPICEVCFSEFYPRGFEGIKTHHHICDKCFNKFDPIYKHFKIEGVEVLALVKYNSYIEKLIFQLKSTLDIGLAQIFLDRFVPYIRGKYHNYIFVPLPSSKKMISLRGFNHLEEMFKECTDKFLDCLIKDDELDQKNLNHLQRLTHRDFIKLDKNAPQRQKNILLIDDVITTGSSLKCAINLLKKNGYCRIKALVFASNYGGKN